MSAVRFFLLSVLSGAIGVVLGTALLARWSSTTAARYWHPRRIAPGALFGHPDIFTRNAARRLYWRRLVLEPR